MDLIDARIKNALIARKAADEDLKNAILEKLVFFRNNPPTFEDFVQWYFETGQTSCHKFAGVILSTPMPEICPESLKMYNAVDLAVLIDKFRPEWTITQCLNWIRGK